MDKSKNSSASNCAFSSGVRVSMGEKTEDGRRKSLKASRSGNGVGGREGGGAVEVFNGALGRTVTCV